MKTWIALFKGINVGGNNKVPMQALVAMFGQLGHQHVRHYIQSGNVVFRSGSQQPVKLAAQIANAMQATFGFSTHVLVIDAQALRDTIAANPFGELDSEDDAKRVHVYFLDRTPDQIDQARLAAVIQPGERWVAGTDCIYLHTPDGAGNSKLAAQVERITGCLATARNWRTVNAIAALCDVA